MNKPKFMEVNLSDVRWGSDASHSVQLIPRARIWTHTTKLYFFNLMKICGSVTAFMVDEFQKDYRCEKSENDTLPKS